MQHQDQVRVLRGLMEQLDSNTNMDAGRQLKNPVSAYTCADRAKREWQEFFKGYPQLLGLSCDLPDANSFFTNDDLGKPILCTRDEDGKFHAFINSCRHRGVIVESELRGKRKVFSCPFHAWSYNTGGDLIAVPREQDFGEVDKACYSLVPLLAEERHGLLWVQPDPNGDLDLDTMLGDLDKELGLWNFDQMHFDQQDCYNHAMNWKLANDTFGETYHFNVLHKDTLAQSFYGNVTMHETFARNHRLTLCMRSIDELRNIPEDQWNIMAGTTPVYFLFPNIQLILTQVGPVLVRIYPRADNPHDSYSRVSFYQRPEVVAMKDKPEFSEMYAMVQDRHHAFGAVIRDEDYVTAAKSHQGLRAGAVDHVLFGRNEPALHHYHNTYNAALNLPALEEA